MTAPSQQPAGSVAIVQSNYIPWKGYFDLIASVDRFILYDDMQYTRRDWRNRNRIKTPQGLQWLTVPLRVSGNYDQPIHAMRIDGDAWIDRHLRALRGNYARARHYDETMAWLAPIYQRRHTHLSALNRDLIEAICRSLGIATVIASSADYRLCAGKTERLVDLCRQAGATRYVSGPAARGYIDSALFAVAGIALDWFDYGGYPEYPQFWGAFEHGVTILDLLFHCGPAARDHMKF